MAARGATEAVSVIVDDHQHDDDLPIKFFRGHLIYSGLGIRPRVAVTFRNHETIDFDDTCYYFNVTIIFLKLKFVSCKEAIVNKDNLLLLFFNHLGFPMEIYIAADGRVLSYILDPNFEKYLPIIPSEVSFKLQLTLFLVGCLFAAC